MQISKLATSAFQSAYAREKPPQDRLMAAFELFRFGFLDNARDVLSDFNQRQPPPRAEWLRQICTRAEIYHRYSPTSKRNIESILFEGLREPVKVRAPSDVMIVQVPGAKQLLISFGGANSAFWVPPPLLNLPNTHVIALRDDRRLWHLSGVRGLGGNYQESVAGLKRLVEELGAEKTVLLGCSSGGYAALRYGLDLDVRAVLGISPITGHEDIPSQLPRFPAIRAVVAAVPEIMVDLLPLYRKHPNPPTILITWGEKNEVDNEQATRMEGLPNVTLAPLPDVSAHAAWLNLLSGQELEPLLLRALAL